MGNKGNKELLIDYLDELPLCSRFIYPDQMFLSSLQLVHSQRSLSTESIADASKMRVKVSITISSALQASMCLSSRCDDRNPPTPGKKKIRSIHLSSSGKCSLDST